jgi:hypothetical protein
MTRRRRNIGNPRCLARACGLAYTHPINEMSAPGPGRVKTEAAVLAFRRRDKPVHGPPSADNAQAKPKHPKAARL